ncbi:hypothetical protein CALCODRAFT_495440 [Calocera cornea HHB12733]|uniref:Secreted protein n=1 Tax=Calocera cornea HHB12733 TaxID=1353952 RepID=A0A165GEJ8_9BASI|nr:hypothetical protein CALCODRAFT_495440 [Calocera cornea HHB12733]
MLSACVLALLGTGHAIVGGSCLVEHRTAPRHCSRTDSSSDRPRLCSLIDGAFHAVRPAPPRHASSHALVLGPSAAPERSPPSRANRRNNLDFLTAISTDRTRTRTHSLFIYHSYAVV